MHIVSCQHPVIVYNPYLAKDIAVPCGHCNTCLSHKAKSWIDRLECERLNSTYTVFFTLTYADEYLPLLQIGWSDNAFLPDKLVHIKRDFSNLPYKKHLSDEYNNFEISFYDSIMAEQSTKNICRMHAGNIPYCSVYDCQTFIKRLRSKCYRAAYGTDSGLTEKQKIRYFLISEYGPTTLRPHYHGLLFFDDSRIETYLSDVFSSCWPFGRFDLQHVSSSASSYVAQYVNCFSYLPRIYQNTALRPFCLSSRHVPIGLRALSDKSIKELFDSSSCLVALPDKTLDSFSYVPLWRCLEDRLYPKLPQNSTLSSSLRLELLGVFTRLSLSTFEEFVSELSQTVVSLCDNAHKNNLVQYLFSVCPLMLTAKDSLYSLVHFFSYDNAIKRIYYVARRISILMYRYGIDIRCYCLHFDRYQSNKELYLLQSYYIYQENFVQSTDSRFLVNCDTVFFNRIRSLSWSELTPRTLLQLYGYGFTYSELKEIYSDEKNKKSYFRQLHHSRTLDYLDMCSCHNKIVNDSRKVRRKNEYLEKHPEYKTLY